MGLESYQAKRKFQVTPEPKGNIERGEGPLRFVIQKHQASRLHFDFRLEADGTLKSWAVPKGPPPTHEEKRLAVLVEDHPLDYLLFEGNIPKGNYGAGTVMVWDEGTYHVLGVANRDKSERLVIQGLEEGKLHVVLHGKKLRGEYALVRTKQKNSWLFFNKGKPRPAPTDMDRSAISGRTMKEIAEGAPRRTQDSAFDLSEAPKGVMPHHVKPMLAFPAEKPFDHSAWLFEVKWDGYRAIAEVTKGQVKLYSRNNLSFEKRFAHIVDSLQHLGHDAVLDGEVVVLDESSRPKFQLLQEYAKYHKGTLVYVVFDLLYLDGHNIEKLPLVRRKEILAGLLGGLPNINLGEHILVKGLAFFRAVEEKGLEGIVAKDGTSKYRQGIRSRSWLKIKTHLRQEAVIGGFTDPKGGRQGLGALILGVYDNGDLIHIGQAGTGFNDKSLADLRSRLDGLVQESCPFKKNPKTNTRAHWVRPQLVCEVTFGEWTGDGIMRHPVFLGLREDKKASEVRRERSEPVNSSLTNSQPKNEKQTAEASIELVRQAKGAEKIGEHLVHFTNLNKVYWPEDGYTKGDLIHYYREVSEFILPYLRDRPESLNRHPNGIHELNFFQKDVSKQPPPPWVQTTEQISDEGKRIRSVICQDEATLVYMANLGCIELNPWHSRVRALDKPDYLMLDLDPEDISFDKVVEVAQAIRKVFENAGAESHCKTSGKRGLHIYVPLGALYSHDQAKQFAELMARIVNAKLSLITSLARNPKDRQRRVYLDYLQNGKGKTLAAPYSVRPRPKATVSTPLKWSEVRKGLDPTKFTIRTMAKRLDSVGDLWKPVLGPGIDLAECLDKLGNHLKRESI